MTEDFEIKLDLTDVYPDKVSGTELADLLKDLEKAVAAEATLVAEGEVEPIDPVDDSPIVSLVAIRDGSAAYGLKIGPRAIAPASRLFRGLARGGSEWTSVSLPAQETITKALAKFTKRDIPVAIKSNLRDVPSVRFGPGSPLPEVNTSMFVEVPATRSVRVVKAGGVRPAATVELIGEKYRVQVSGNKRIIKQLGEKLYDHRLIPVGTAVWRLKDWKMIQFTAVSIHPFPGDDIGKALAEAARLSGDT